MSKKFFALMLLSMTILFGGCSDSADVKDNSKTANNTNAAQVSTISLNIGDKIGQSGMEGYTQLDGDSLIGEQDGKWVKYFEEMYLTTSKKLGGNYYFKRVYADSDAIIFDYEQSDTKKICNVMYRWNEATKSFDSEVVQ